MDAYGATKVVLARIQAMDPENAAKIMGLLLSQDAGGAEMIRLAMASEAQLLAAVAAARRELNLSPPHPLSPPVRARVPPSPLYIPSPSSLAPFSGEEPGDALLEEQFSFLNDDESRLFPFAADGSHRRSASVSDLPCMYFTRGYCKNGSACRFVHGDDISAIAGIEQELLRSKSQRLSSFPYSPNGGSSLPVSPSPASKCISYLLQQQQQQSDRERASAAAAALMLNCNDDVQRFISRPRLDFATLMNPSARQIYLTFPADSTFSEEDVSNYFSIYGPVQDVRIPYQQKRMFGFVTFVYPETVKLILAKGNPHFICESRVLVKPYKEKGKVPDKFRRPFADFSGCLSPTGLTDSRDHFDLHQLGSRLMHSNSANELLFRKKLEEQQHAAELQQALELQTRRLMNLQMLDLKARGELSSLAAVDSGLEQLRKGGLTVQSSTVSGAVVGGGGGGDKEASSGGTSSPSTDSDFKESGEPNLPDSPFASPSKNPFAAAAADAFASSADDDNPASTVSASPKPYFPISRMPSSHGAIGM